MGQSSSGKNSNSKTESRSLPKADPSIQVATDLAQLKNQTATSGSSSAELLKSFRPTSPADLTEAALAHKASYLATAFQGRLPLASELRNVTEELGVELATALFLRTVHDSTTHGPFGKRVRAFDFAGWNSKLARAAQIEVCFVASNLFQSGRKWGDHCEDWRAWARDLGFSTDVIETDPRRSIASNARVIFDYLAETPSRKRIVVTYGQGSAEFRYMLHRRVERDELIPVPDEVAQVRGWINVCGAFAGAGSSRYFQENRLRRLLSRLRMKVAGRNPVVLAETSPNFPLWRKPLPDLPSLFTASIVGVPYRAQIPAANQSLYTELARSFPNDGAVTVLDAIAHPGNLLTVPGLAHHAPNSMLEPIFKRMLAVVAQEADKMLLNDVDAEIGR